MNSYHRVPAALSVLSYLFLFFGVWSALIQIIQLVMLFRGSGLGIQPGIIGIWIYRGLRRGSSGWRLCALYIVCSCIAIGLFGLGLPFFYDKPVLFNGWGHSWPMPAAVFLAIVMSWLLASVWAFWVLTRRDVPAWFLSAAPVS